MAPDIIHVGDHSPVHDNGWSAYGTNRQSNPDFSAQTPRREFAIAEPAKWNAFRLQVTADDKAGVRIAAIELLEAIHCRANVAVTSLALDQTKLSLSANSRVTVNATIAPLDAFQREVAWVSSDANVAEVKRIGEQSAMGSA
jgi:hypothetical protein